MKRRRFLKLIGALGVFLAGVGAVVVRFIDGGDAEVMSETVIQISGNFAGTIPVGTTGHIVGNVNLTGDLIVEGVLTGVDTFTVTGNGFQILVQNGGVCSFAGIVKSGWVRRGDSVTGWVTGDRLAVAPTKAGVYVPTVITWGGSWAATPMPVNSPDVTLVDGSVAKPEVANLTRSITMTGLRRFHFHNGAGVQSLKHFALVNCGTLGVLGDYPLHFHLNGETVRGSLVEGVVVEGGKNHAFVPHGSHGITLTDTVAYNTTADAYWWDPPFSNNQPSPNDSSDIVYSHALALGVTGPANPTSLRLTGFLLGRGVGNRVVDSAASAVGLQGATQSSGFSWPETGQGVWAFTDSVAHNNKYFGIFTWQNNTADHVIEDFVAYRNGQAGIAHGAYLNFYLFRNITLTGNGQYAFMNFALSHNLGSQLPDKRLVIENVQSDGQLLVGHHNQSSPRPTIYRNDTFTGVTYIETNPRSSYNVFEDCGLEPSDFTLTLIQPQSVIEIKEGGVLTHRWAAGGWG